MTLPFYPFYWGDYSSKTFNLTMGQHGAYMLLLRHIYCTGLRIPHESRYSVAVAKNRSEKDSVDFVLASYFERDGDFWRHLKAEEVMQEAYDKHQFFVESGKRGGRPKKSPPYTPPFSGEKPPHKQPEPKPYPEVRTPLAPQGGEGALKEGFSHGRRKQRYSNRDSFQQAVAYIEAREQGGFEESGANDPKLLS